MGTGRLPLFGACLCVDDMIVCQQSLSLRILVYRSLDWLCVGQMSVGAPPWIEPSPKDPGFRAFQRGNIIKMLKGWNRLSYVGKMRLDLLTRMLTQEDQRLSMKQCREHEWMSSYFGTRRTM